LIFPFFAKGSGKPPMHVIRQCHQSLLASICAECSPSPWRHSIDFTFAAACPNGPNPITEHDAHIYFPQQPETRRAQLVAGLFRKS
jgi:hypothetical protein